MLTFISEQNFNETLGARKKKQLNGKSFKESCIPQITVPSLSFNKLISEQLLYSYTL